MSCHAHERASLNMNGGSGGMLRARIVGRKGSALDESILYSRLPSTLPCPRGMMHGHRFQCHILAIIPSKTANSLRYHFSNIGCSSKQGSQRQGGKAHHRNLPARPENPT